MKQCLISLLLWPLTTPAQLRLAKIFSDNIILQSDAPIPILGNAIPGKTVRVFFVNETRTAIAQKDSSWSVYLKKQKGESNSLEKERVEEYNDLLHLLIADYRRVWKQLNMPFYWVQLSPIDTTNYKSQYWPQFRDGQRRLLNQVKYSGMAVSSDVGFRRDVHPTNKKVIGERLARWALLKDYGKKIIPSGPLPLDAKYQVGKVVVTFRYAKRLRTSDGKALCRFSFDGKTEAAATIQNDVIILASSQKPAFVYYGWKPFSDGNLVNGENLPASTFKMEVK